jgi:hypothetical protein
MSKPYIFPENQFSPETVPTPWFDFVNADKTKDKTELLDIYIPIMLAWVHQNWGRFDDEDKDYVLKMIGWIGNPLIRHESMNFLAIVKSFFT